MLNIIACSYVKESGKEGWEKIYDLYKNSNDPTEKDIYMFALSCSRDQNILKR